MFRFLMFVTLAPYYFASGFFSKPEDDAKDTSKAVDEFLRKVRA